MAGEGGGGGGCGALVPAKDARCRKAGKMKDEERKIYHVKWFLIGRDGSTGAPPV